MIDQNEKQILIDFRTNQSMGSRLCEYITGMRPNDPRMLERLVRDRDEVFQKYQIPDDELLNSDPEEFEIRLRRIAEDRNIKINEDEWAEEYLKEIEKPAVFNEGDLSITIIIDRKDEKTLHKSLKSFRHEILHGIQLQEFPGLKIEQAEYEAHLTSLNEKFLRENPEDIELIFFQFLVGGSVTHWYREESKDKGVLVKPEWNDAAWCLKNIDMIDINEEQLNKFESELDEFEELISSEHGGRTLVLASKDLAIPVEIQKKLLKGLETGVKLAEKVLGQEAYENRGDKITMRVMRNSMVGLMNPGLIADASLMNLREETIGAVVLHEFIEGWREDRGFLGGNPEQQQMLAEYLFCGSDRSKFFQGYTIRMHEGDEDCYHKAGWLQAMQILLPQDEEVIDLVPESIWQKLEAKKASMSEDEKIDLIKRTLRS